MNELPIDVLRSFVSVAQAGGFTAAAKQLGTTQASVSRRVAQLERALGVALLRRTTRRMRLTEAGQIYLDRIQSVLDDIEAAQEAVHTLNTAPAGVLRVAAPASLGIREIAPLLADFHDRYPAIRVGLFLRDTLIDLVTENIDVAIRFGHQQDSTLVARRLAQSKFWVCGSPAYLKRFGEITDPEQLTEANCLLYRESAQSATWAFSRGEEQRAVEVSGALFSDNADALLSAAVTGAGLVKLPQWMVQRDTQAGRLCRVMSDWSSQPGSSGVYAVYAHRQRQSARMKVFVDYVADAMAERDWNRL